SCIPKQAPAEALLGDVVRVARGHDLAERHLNRLIRPVALGQQCRDGGLAEVKRDQAAVHAVNELVHEKPTVYVPAFGVAELTGLPRELDGLRPSLQASGVIGRSGSYQSVQIGNTVAPAGVSYHCVLLRFWARAASTFLISPSFRILISAFRG